MPATATDGSQEPLTVPALIPASSSLSSGPSSDSNYGEDEIHVLFPDHESRQNGAPPALFKHASGTPLPIDGQEQIVDIINIDNLEREYP